ncbi:MAG TPA: serine hydrolase domain-containing protein [Caulobacteraceae bacterium]|jgi:CubicO group peptidase (beta-lactamase class C family)|nr:serine hydrolase domain-containing protein [Caulobacteraceae bacterium]
MTMIAAAAVAVVMAGAVALAKPPVSAPAPAAPPAPSAPAGHALDQADVEAWLDGYMPYAIKNGDIAGAVVIVVKDGKVLYERGYGYADVAKKTPMDPEQTMVRAGSTSKLFTWTAVMQLVEQGKLDLDTDVNKYLDFKVPEKFGKPVTLRDLMNHEGGFEEGLKDVLTVDPKNLISTETYLKTHPRPMLFAPGTVPAYSNYGASLAGYIVQRVSGEPFEAYVQHHIFTPLGMAHSTFVQPLPQQFAGAISKGYYTPQEPKPFELVETAPAGSLSTTVSDLSRFMIADMNQGRFENASILRPETVQLMLTPTESNFPGFATMAHGYFHEYHNGRLVMGHGGDTIVFHNEFDFLPSEGVGLIYNFNSRGKGSAVYGVRSGLLDGFMNRYFPAAPSAPVRPLASAKADAQAIAGRYWSSRRIEHGFMSLFYLLQQDVIAAKPDGTILAPGDLGGEPGTYQEVAPNVWQMVGGTKRLALEHVNGVKTVAESDDPTSVLQQTPAMRSSGLNLPILFVSFAVLLWTILLWPLSALLQRGQAEEDPATGRLRLLFRVAAIVDVVYLTGWYFAVSPLINAHYEVYDKPLDPMIATLEGAGVIAILLAIAGVWAAWRMIRLPTFWRSRIWGVIVAASLVGVVWIAFAGGLLDWRLNY